MSETTSRRALGRAILRVVLPLVAVVLGVIFFVMGIFSVRADPLLRAGLLLGGAAALASGFLALLWGIRARFAEEPAVRAVAAVRSDLALAGLLVVIGLVGASTATGNVVADFGPAQVLDGRLAQLHVHDARRSGGGAELTLEEGSPRLSWRCNFDCAPLVDLQDLRTRAGARLHVTALGHRLIGLVAEEREILWPDGERDRLKATDITMLLLFAALAAGAGAYMPWRYRSGFRPTRVDSNAPDYRVLLQNSLSRRTKDPS